MLKKSNFTMENIKRLQTESGRDPALLERTIYAFGLLQALKLADFDFVFKGGTCLMLLLDKPKRLSTDIDIIVKPGTDIDTFIEKASAIFPFKRQEEQTRHTFNKINKRHFKFYYTSPINNYDFHIILDVLFEENNYSSTIKKEIANSLLDTEAPAVFVTIPTINCILGDKLTAFAPHTIGIPFGIGKEMEVIKQLYDVATLLDKLDNFTEVKETYKRVAQAEIEYRNLSISTHETLIDSFNSAITIIGKGKLFLEDYKKLLDGMHRIKNHIFESGYSPVIAEGQACRVAYLIANILADNEEYTLITNIDKYKDKMITNPTYTKLSYMKKANLTDFAYLYEAIKLFEKNQ